MTSTAINNFSVTDDRFCCRMIKRGQKMVDMTLVSSSGLQYSKKAIDLKSYDSNQSKTKKDTNDKSK